ncbi:helix-turn-helix transcriptional regulator [Streptacidiphilus cavernicola]|uniref:LuxR C-terminal-related transcriptional regulator n=1 Tax=Streptacidiphilus cavernicola TaxID=3342716 RepID=A0ABV6VVU9_9ACTN
MDKKVTRPTSCPHCQAPKAPDIPVVRDLLDALRETAVLAAEQAAVLDQALARRPAGASAAVGPGVPWGEEISGLPNISAAIDAEVDSARKEILTAQPDGPRPPSTLTDALASIEDKVKSGVTMRTLYQHTARFDEATKEYVRSVTEIGAEVRTLSEFFERLLVFDRRVAFIPCTADRTRALRITHPALVGFLSDDFGRAWDRAAAYPFVPNHSALAAAEVLPDLRYSIKRLLIRGHSDAAIARRLGISSRSLQSHIQRIKQDLGAVNRLQLGFLLALEDRAAFDASAPAPDLSP